MTILKICGLTQPEHIEHCIALGVDYVGFVAYAKSPRHITPEQFHTLAALATSSVQAVLVTVNMIDEMLDGYLTPLPLGEVGEANAETGEGVHPHPKAATHLLTSPGGRGVIVVQCHGSESPARLREIRARYGCKIIKAITHPAQAEDYADAADFLLLDAPPATGELPGGNARTLDWSSLQGFSPALPWFLSGGLTAQNVQQAIAMTGAKMLDVSSGVERERGVKDIKLIEEFVHAARI